MISMLDRNAMAGSYAVQFARYPKKARAAYLRVRCWGAGLCMSRSRIDSPNFSVFFAYFSVFMHSKVKQLPYLAFPTPP